MNNSIYLSGDIEALDPNRVIQALTGVGKLAYLQKVQRWTKDADLSFYECAFINPRAAEEAVHSAQLRGFLGQSVTLSKTRPFQKAKRASATKATKPASAIKAKNRASGAKATKLDKCPSCGVPIKHENLPRHLRKCSRASKPSKTPRGRPQASDPTKSGSVGSTQTTKRTGDRSSPSPSEAPHSSAFPHPTPEAPTVPPLDPVIRDAELDLEPGQVVRHFNRKWSPHGSTQVHLSFEEQCAMEYHLKGLNKPDGLPEDQIRCACCGIPHKIGPHRQTNLICRVCEQHGLTCARCSAKFRPSSETFGRICGPCWRRIREGPDYPATGCQGLTDSLYLSREERVTSRGRCSHPRKQPTPRK